MVALLAVAACASPRTTHQAQAPTKTGASPLQPSSTSAPTAASATPPDESSARVLREALLSSSRAFEFVRSLTDDVGPRLSGSLGSKAAVAWAERTLAEEGLARVHAEPVKVPHWERGEEHGTIVAPVWQPLALTALGGSVGTKPDGLEAEVFEVDSLEAIEKADPKAVKGKIVFYDVQTERTRDGSGYGRAVRVRAQAAVGAAKLGARGVVIRSIGTDESRMPHTGAMRYEDKVQRIPAAALATTDADMLHRLMARGLPVRLRMTLGAKILPDADGANVVGDVEGSGAADEIVLLGAHLDSWDLGRGALDDGAGCAIVIEAARQIAKLPKRPRRTVRVVLFANEENGLAGAKGYAAAHGAELAHHALAFEADLGAGRVYETRFLGPPAAVPAFHATAASLVSLGVAVSDEDAHGGSDLGPLVAAGVPVMDLRQEATSYFDVHHTANDTLERVARKEIDQAATAFALAALAAADGTTDFGRIPEEKRSRR